MPAPIAPCARSRVRMRGAIAAITTLIAMLAIADSATSAPKRPAKKKAVVVSSTQTSFEAVLDAQKPAVVDCVMMHGISKGAASVTLNLKLLINRQGQLFNVDLQVTGGDQAELSTCIKQALAPIQFPSSPSALTELRRQWTFAST